METAETMLRFILFFTTVSFVRATSDTEAKLQRRVELLEATVKQLLERDAQREAAISVNYAPRRLAAIKPTDRKGVNIASDKAWLTMGEKDGVLWSLLVVSSRVRALPTFVYSTSLQISSLFTPGTKPQP